jgi:(p)ppGpp synthase/HD superfamily hydrolase
MEAAVKDDNIAEIKFILEVKSNTHLNEIISKIKKIGNINDVYKVNEKVVIQKK